MKRNKLALYLHLVWATWDRLPWIEPSIERRLHRNIAAQARNMGCAVLALNGMPDHVHLVVTLPANVTVANLVKQLKGASSHFAGETLGLGPGNKWQGMYGAFTISRWDLDRVIGYVKRQKEHHAAGDIVAEWEEAEEERPAD